MHRILLVDDDDALRSTLAGQLRLYEDLSTAEAATAAEGLAAIGRAHFDLILLDVGLPDMDGRNLCRLMRKHGVKAPVIMLTAQASDADAILGLERAAIVWPDDPRRVRARLWPLLQSQAAPAPPPSLSSFRAERRSRAEPDSPLVSN